jgi:hypothetical protein
MQDAMARLFAEGWIAGLLLAVLAAEFVILVARHRRGRGGLRPRAALLLVLPGAGFVLAIQAALSGAHWSLVGLGLVLAGLAHLADLAERLRR